MRIQHGGHRGRNTEIAGHCYFLDFDKGNGGNHVSLSNLGEILDDDLEAGSLEIR